MSNRKKDQTSTKGSKVKIAKNDKQKATSQSELSEKGKTKSTKKKKSKRSVYSPTSVLKMASKSFKFKPQQPNANESTYGALPEAKGFSTSVYKKGVQGIQGRESQLPIDSAKEDYKNDGKPDSSQHQATYYLTTKGFRVLDKVGSGNYAKVYRVINPDNREIAVKIIDLSKTSSNYKMKFLPRELDILTKVNHKNIAKIFEIVQLPKLIYIFMEYTPNGTVADFLRVYRAIPENFCQCMFIRIVDALHYLHKTVNVAHRDLKLENILIDKQGQPKLTDFSYSIVCKSGNKTLSRTFCGSLPYIAPEILKESPYDPKISDIWSLGVCLFVMLNDGVPFKFSDPPTMLQSQLNRNWKFKTRVANTLSDDVKDLVKLMLEPEPKLRIDASGVQSHPWCTKCI